MIVVRHTLQVKDQDKDEFVEMVKSWPDLGFPSPPHGQRIYTWGHASVWGVVIWEQDFESMAEQDAFSKEWYAKPEASEQLDKFNKLVESRDSRTELWKVEHLK